MEEPANTWDDAGVLYCQALVACHFVWYDPEKPDQGFSLGRVVVRMAPEKGASFPLSVPRLFVYAQLFGSPGDYHVRLRLQRVVLSDIGEEETVPLGNDGADLEYGPRRIELIPEDHLLEVAMPMPNVVFEEAGDYEVQLRVGEKSDSEPIQTYRFRVLERHL